jgi:hypothetical protein
VHGRLPHPRALGEHLHSVGLQRLSAIDGGVDPAGRLDVGAEQHRMSVVTADR